MSIKTVDKHIVYRHEDTGVTFVWYGGEYIDVGYMEDCEFIAEDCINVWDHANSRSRIAFHESAMAEHCDEWMNRCDECGGDPDMCPCNGCVGCGADSASECQCD